MLQEPSVINLSACHLTQSLYSPDTQKNRQTPAVHGPNRVRQRPLRVMSGNSECRRPHGPSGCTVSSPPAKVTPERGPRAQGKTL